jgi:aminoglycoside phosphotransferase (APT) family kinase protein
VDSSVADISAVDFSAVCDWMDEHGLSPGQIRRPERVGGGTQNVLVRFERGGREYMLRRGPPHLRPGTNDVLRREMRVLESLSTTDVPHPRLIAGCPDEAVLGDSVFYLMEPVDGFNATIELPPLHAGDSGLRRRMGVQVVDALARLGAVDHRAVGLDDLGRPEGFIERQVPRWLAELDSFGRLQGYRGPEIPHVDQVADWLERNRPHPGRPGLMHGDFHLANVLYRRHGPEVAAIVDWEMCTVGDPLLDLGWLLATWPSPEGSAADVGGLLAQAGGLPSRNQLVAAYAERSDRDLSAITWYTVLGCFKLGILLEGTYARAMAGKAPMAVGERLHASTLGLFARGRKIISG